MIRPAALTYVLGQFLIVLGATMLVPLALALFSNDDDIRPMTWAFLITFGAGAALVTGFEKPKSELSLREGLMLVTVVWLCACLFGCLPFHFSGQFPTFTDALFEATSGFTTTGATVLADVEVLSRSVQFWRHFSHWLGGMGIVLLGVAILPLIGLGGMHLYRAEFSGAKSEKLKPRITETALSLWKIYFGLSFAEYIALRAAGMDTFEAVCHTMSTLGTGGFSTRTASVGGFESPAIEWIIIVFMILAGINFTRHYRLWVEHDTGSFFRDAEVRTYLMLIFGASLLIFTSLLLQGGNHTGTALRAAVFQVTSIVTTTGFATADYELWLPLPQLILLFLMFSGGCTGSTSGGLKVARFMLLGQVVTREFKRMVERRGVFAVRLGAHVIPEATIQRFLNLLYLAFLVNAASCLALAAMGVDILTSIAAVIACMFNIGPGLGEVGPADNYGHMPLAAKWVLSACMIGGRLEFYTALVILTPAFWRK